MRRTARPIREMTNSRNSSPTGAKVRQFANGINDLVRCGVRIATQNLHGRGADDIGLANVLQAKHLTSSPVAARRERLTLCGGTALPDQVSSLRYSVEMVNEAVAVCSSSLVIVTVAVTSRGLSGGDGRAFSWRLDLTVR